ncbi:uncharacterized protein SPPG_05858 [Spizellomyces punctatus DAOM BR117]|uniref:ABC transporter domain-containing protein n=1 Tax=Spizellomyces punctatus (strain DAOM BR117) TaxID=645134 RepID=A0A0L0HD09_SPIPD|nr:uncharacterized protein SPPG_05858 [Spizellomyces punctatus DAOM BR117]KNC98891.1 hypothetical protein SPPG_05858 [Spizellomyces punctatus DAOM BR117]|eukprot:XP_016606931.1 hypothetical protein SPPG_05858 [Spizellomyces punctatus DAOM BR117]
MSISGSQLEMTQTDPPHSSLVPTREADENVVIPLDDPSIMQREDGWAIPVPKAVGIGTESYVTNGGMAQPWQDGVKEVEKHVQNTDRPPRPERTGSLIRDSISISISTPSDQDTASEVRQRTSRQYQDGKGREQTFVEGHEDGDGSAGCDGRMDIYWENVRYSVTVGRGKSKKEKEILKGVSGRARPGEMVAIMGGSGAGKSTLLNVLAGRVPTGTPTGVILANGRIREKRTWKRLVGYVEQEDLMYENLTVRETLTTAALLRLPNSRYTKDQKLARVDEVLAELGLTHVADSRIGNSQMGGISGGEKKRVSIGIELVTNPGTLFLDEPTTGLDSATARNICDMLKNLAKKSGKTIIMTIHMPRETILDMIDRVALMSYGKMVWFGPAKDALKHFAQLGYKCPPQTNPADFFLDLIQVDTRDPTSQERLKKLLDAWDRVSTQYVKPIDSALRETATGQQQALKEKKGARHKVEDDCHIDRWAVPWPVECGVLLQRNLKHVWRSKIIIISTLIQQFILFLIIGFVFFRISDDQAGVQNRYGVLFFICINQTFSFLMPIITVFPLERRIILRERAAGSYRVSAAYLAKSLSQWPLAICASLLFSLPVYWLIGLQPNVGRWILFIVITQCLVFAAQSLGMLIGSSVPNVQMAQVFGPLVVVLFVIFGGNFANQDSITPVLRWIQWISIIRYAYGAYMQNEFYGLEFQCPGGGGGASGGALCAAQGEQIVKSFGLDTPSKAVCIIVLVGLGLAFQVLAALVLRRTTRLRIKII